MDQSIARYRDAFAADPNNVNAFEALEEHYFVSGEWEELKSLYSGRLAAPGLADQPTQRARLGFRLGQVIEERLLDPEAALVVYWEVVGMDSQFRPALRQIRSIHARREQWDMVLQVAEMEAAGEMKPYDRATFQVEMGSIWQRELGDAEQALSCFEEALEAVPNQQGALTGKALCLEALGRPHDAVEQWEALIALLRGPERAPAEVHLAKLLGGAIDDAERSAEFYRRALTDDPGNVEALEALVSHAAVAQRWPLLADLYERRFDLTGGARNRTTVALEASRLHLEQLDNPSAARVWLNRAFELCPDEVEVHYGIAELERRDGDPEALVKALDRLIELTREAAPIGTLIEAAELHEAAGRQERCVELLNVALDRAPDDPRVLEALSSNLEGLGRSAELADILERRAALVDDPDDRSDLLVELGRVYSEDLGDPDARREALVRAFELRPEAPGVAATLAGIHRSEGRWDALREVLTRAAECGPSDERCGFRCDLGESLLEHEADPGAAAEAFEAALALDPNCARAFAGLERIAERSGDPSAMLEAWQRELDVSSDDARIAELLERCVSALESQGEHEQALEGLQRLLTLRPHDRELLEATARLQEELGREDALAATLDQIDPLLSENQQVENRLRLATLHTRAGRDLEAAQCYEGVLEGDPRNLDALTSLRVHYLGARDWEPLAAVCRRLADLETGANRRRRLAELADLLEAQIGDRNGAIETLLRLADLSREETGSVAGDVLERLGLLLEREGRTEEFADVLAERVAGLDEANPLRTDLELERALLLLDPLGRLDEAAVSFRHILARRPDELQAEDGLERAIRGSGDIAALVELLAERAESETDAALRVPMQFERATLLDEKLGRPLEAAALYSEIADDPSDAEAACEAETQLQQLLERCEDWNQLRSRLLRQIDRPDVDQSTLRERLAELSRDRLDDPEALREHLEALAALEPSRTDVWCALSELYGAMPDRGADLLRVTEAELAARPSRERRLVLLGRAARARAALPDGEQAASGFYSELLELEPGNSEACEHLIARNQRDGAPEAVLRLLEDRLAADADVLLDERASVDRRLSLLLRIAVHLSEQMDDTERAIETLETALAENGAVAAVAEPLFALYEGCGQLDERIEIARRAAETAGQPEERARWNARLGTALCQRARDADLGEAIGAFQAVLVARPGDREATRSLCELYRESDQPGPLAALLAEELENGRASQPQRARLELANLLGQRLDRPEDALAQLRELLLDAPQDQRAFEAALKLANQLERHDERLELIDARLSRPVLSDEKAALLELRADLLAGPLERLEEAAATYREVARLRQDREPVLAAWRGVLRRLERWPELLEAIEVSARGAAPEARAELFRQAVSIASEQIGGDAALPWLERLREIEPRDASIHSRIARLHREAGRSAALLRAIDAELALTSDSTHETSLQRARAELLAGACEAPGLAAEAYERVLQLAPDDADARDALDALYERLSRPADRLRMIELRIARHAGDVGERIELHRRAARLCSDALGHNEDAAAHWLQAVDLCCGVSAAEPGRLAELLRCLAQCLRACRRTDAWARALETELALIDRNSDDAAAIARRAELHQQLASAYRDELGRPDASARHLRELAAEPFDAALRRTAEGSLLDALRAGSEHVELAERLAARLARGDGNPAEWLELARLHDERLQALPAAAAAYRALLDADPEPALRLAGIRGARNTAERLADWPEVAAMLEAELEADADATASERSALLRRLGEVCWHRLQRDDDAADAYTRALEVQPKDLAALRSLEQLREERGEWTLALDLYDREIEALGGDDPERRLEAALHVAELSRTRARDPQRALRAFEFAAELADDAPQASGPSLAQRRQWADLYLEVDQAERFADIFADWCDAAESGAGCDDHLRLAQVLEDLGRADDALARALRASECDPEDARSWDLAASLQEAAGDTDAAAASFERAAACLSGSPGAQRLCWAASLVDDAERSADLLRRAVAADAACVPAQAMLAEAEARLDHWQAAESAAATAIELSAGSADAPLTGEALVATALIGGRAARELEHLERSADFFATALDSDANHSEAMDERSDVLFALGDLEGARSVLGARLAQTGDNPRRAEQLVMAGLANERLGSPIVALQQFREALEIDRTQDDAHRGIVKIHEDAGRDDMAVAALALWCQSSPGSSAEQYVRAARIELRRDETESAERLLRSAVEADADHAPGWVMLAQLLWDTARPADALDAAERGLRNCSDRDARSCLEVVRGRALERQGDASAAAEAFGAATACDARRIDAALSQARLLRSAGEWLPAATALGGFVEAYPDADDPALAPLFFEWGRLLAGPLENTDEAMQRYERALELDPTLAEAREQLANLWTHVSSRWCDAARLHGQSLAERPTHGPSLRAMMRIAHGTGAETPIRFGLALLRALGSASPDERNEAPATLPLEIAADARLASDAFENARQLVLQCAAELADAMPPYADPLTEDAVDASDPIAAYRYCVRNAEEALLGEGLAKYSASELGDAIRTLIDVCMGRPDAERGSGLHARLAQSLGRWTRRKLRRTLESISEQEIDGIDFDVWRAEIRSVATAVAVDRSGGELRSALVSLCREDAGSGMNDPSESADITGAVAASPSATQLLGRVVGIWCTEVTRASG